MEALIRFWLDMSPFTLTPEDRSQLDEGFDSWTAKNFWLRENRERIGLPEACGFFFWDKNLQAFYIVEGNGKKIPYSTRGFETPSYLPDPTRYPMTSVSAVVYFETHARLDLGEYEIEFEEGTLEQSRWTSTKVKTVLDIETVKSGAVRYELFVGHGDDLEQLAQVTSLIRSGAVRPKVLWY